LYMITQTVSSEDSAWSSSLYICLQFRIMLFLIDVNILHNILSRGALVGSRATNLTLNSMAQIHTSVTLLTSREITWRKSDKCESAPEISMLNRLSIPTARVKSHELTWREDSVSPA
jgi:hypothetical protein